MVCVCEGGWKSLYWSIAEEAQKEGKHASLHYTHQPTHPSLDGQRLSRNCPRWQSGYVCLQAAKENIHTMRKRKSQEKGRSIWRKRNADRILIS